MRIAICFSGQLRTAVHAAPAIKRWIGDLWENCDFFIHTWDINTYIGLQSEFKQHYNILTGLELNYKNVNIQKVVENTEKEFLHTFYRPKIFEIENYENWLLNYSNLIPKELFFTYPPYYPPYYYSFYNSIEYKKQYEKNNNFIYDVVIKLRPDCSFLIPPAEIYKDGVHMATNHINKNDATHLCHDLFEFIKNSNYLYSTGEELWLGSSETMNNMGNIWHNYKLHISKYAEQLNIQIKGTATKNYTFHRYLCQSLDADDWPLIHLLQRMGDQGNFIDDINFLNDDVKERFIHHLKSDKFLDLLYDLYEKL